MGRNTDTSQRQRSHALQSSTTPTPFAFDGHTGLHLVRSMGAFSLPDASDEDWLIEDPASFVDIMDGDIGEVLRFTRCMWLGPSLQVSAVLDGRCYGIGVAALKRFSDGTLAVNLTYAVREEARGARLGAVLSALATFELRQVLKARGRRNGSAWPGHAIVNVQTRATNEASRRLARGMGLQSAPEHGFVAHMRDGREIDFEGFDASLDAFQARMAPMLAERIAISDAYDPLNDILEPCELAATASEHRPRERQV